MSGWLTPVVGPARDRSRPPVIRWDVRYGFGPFCGTFSHGYTRPPASEATTGRAASQAASLSSITVVRSAISRRLPSGSTTGQVLPEPGPQVGQEDGGRPLPGVCPPRPHERLGGRGPCRVLSGPVDDRQVRLQLLFPPPGHSAAILHQVGVLRRVDPPAVHLDAVAPPRPDDPDDHPGVP